MGTTLGDGLFYWATGINNSGNVVGYAWTFTPPPFIRSTAFFWSDGQMSRLDPGGDNAARGINNNDQVVGEWRFPFSGPFQWHAATWNGTGGLSDLGTLPGFASSFGYDINDNGQVAGFLDDPSGRRAFLWDSAQGMRDLGTLGGTRSEAHSINNSGQVVGKATGANGLSHAFLWTSSQGMRDLGTLGGASSEAIAINNLGQVVGQAVPSGGAVFHAFLWSSTAGMLDLGTLGGLSSTAYAINNRGQVVETSYTPDGVSTAFIWDSTNGMRELHTLLPPGSGWVLDAALGINDAGQIVGYGRHNDLQALSHAFILSPPPCDRDTISAPAPQTVSGHNWSMDVEVSANDGVILRNVKLGDRYMAKEMSVPYYVLQTSGLPATRAELKPNSNDATARSRLISYNVRNDAQKLVIEATYAVDRIPANSQSCLQVTQQYEFYAAGIGCEPSETLPCSRFKPMVKYKFLGQGGETLTSLNVVQRNYFRVEDKNGNTNGIFRDCDDPRDPFGPCFASIFLSKRNPLLTEHLTRVVENGNDRGTWDNLHQTYNSIVKEPSFLGLIGVTNDPGCPECVHIHWRWGLIASLPPFGSPAFGSGLPLIPQGSNQSVDFAVARWHAGEEDPRDYTNLVFPDAEPLIQDVVFWYSATGHQNEDAFFTHGGFFNPAFRSATVQSGPVTITYFNLFEDGPLTVTPVDPSSAGQLPPGYEPYNNLAYDIATEAVVSGPHTVSFNVPSATDPALFADLRVLHGEADPNDPTNLVLVDRTILGPDSPAPDFLTKTISARVDSLSPFVIARLVNVNRPPISQCKNITVNAGSSCTATITPADINDGSVDPDGDALSLALDSTGPFGPGPHTVTLTVTDSHGASSSCSSTVTVVDGTPPSISAPANASYQCLSQVPTARGTDATATDNCGAPSVTVTESNNGGAGSPASPLLITRTYTATDASGNSASATQSITVVDNTPPAIACPSNIVVDQSNAPGQCSAVVSYTVAATDNCSSATVVCSPATGSTFAKGTTTVSCSAVDPAGNASTCSFTVTVIPSQLTTLSPAMVWLGLKNSDDVGTKFDLLAEVLKNGAVVGSGQLNDVPGGSSGFNNAVLRTVNLALSAPVDFCTGDTLSFRLSVRIAATSGHRAGTARLWFNDAAANSRFGATIGGSTNSYYLTASLLSTVPGAGPKITSDVLVDRAVDGNPFRPFGTWSITF